MRCYDCDFYKSTYAWNRCELLEAECFHTFNVDPCPVIDNDYKFTQDCEGLGFTKGQDARKFVLGE